MNTINLRHVYRTEYLNYDVKKSKMKIKLFLLLSVQTDALVQIRPILSVMCCFERIFFRLMFVLFGVNYKWYFFLGAVFILNNVYFRSLYFFRFFVLHICFVLVCFKIRLPNSPKLCTCSAAVLQCCSFVHKTHKL
jgi:hypothetical protein